MAGRVNEGEGGASPPRGVSWEQEYRDLEGAIKLRHYSGKTHDAYRMWVRKFQDFTRSKAPEELGTAEVKRFLTDLARPFTYPH